MVQILGVCSDSCDPAPQNSSRSSQGCLFLSSPNDLNDTSKREYQGASHSLCGCHHQDEMHGEEPFSKYAYTLVVHPFNKTLNKRIFISNFICFINGGRIRGKESPSTGGE